MPAVWSDRPTWQEKRCAHVRDGAQVRVVAGRRIGTGAFEQDQVAAARLTGSLDAVAQFLLARHAGRDDHRLARGRGLADEGQVGILERGDFVARDAEGFEKLDRAGVERRAEPHYPTRLAALEEWRVPLPRRARFLVELVEVLAAPQAVGVIDAEAPLGAIERHGVRCIRLNLDCVRPCLRGRVDDGEGALERLVMIAGHLGDDQRPMAGPDQPLADAHDIAHGATSSRRQIIASWMRGSMRIRLVSPRRKPTFS